MSRKTKQERVEDGTDLESFLAEIGASFRPQNLPTKITLWEWPKDRAGGKYDRTLVAREYEDGSFAIGILCEQHGWSERKAELKKYAK